MPSDLIRGYMIKFTKLVFVVLLFIQSNATFATLITSDLTPDTYVSNNGIDWTWASPVNAEFFGSNQLMAPSFHDGWRYATVDELSYLVNFMSIADFTRADGSLIHSAEYWNTVYTHVDKSNFENAEISSMWNNSFNTYFETVYVRASQTTPVPEPTNIAIFGLGLIALAFRKKFN